MILSLTGVQRYWFHDSLKDILQAQSGWTDDKVREFLSRNEIITFNSVSEEAAKQILGRLEAAGFVLQLTKIKGGLRALLAMPRESEITWLRKSLGAISARLDDLEQRPGASVKREPVLQTYSAQAAFGALNSKIPAGSTAAQAPAGRSSAESNIGKYWLSRIGIFSLVLGVVLFISYSFQFIGPLGKVFIGLVIGTLLVGAGNYLARRENYRRWAMALIGGGWAVIYFTLYAAYAIPATKVIDDPLLGLAALLFAAAASIAQALRYESPVLVIFSYFLGYLAITMVSISYYTLIASFLLAASIVIVVRRMGWSWLALFGLAAVYLTHFVWLEPILYGIQGWRENQVFDLLLLPWVGEEWRVHPIISADQSRLHLAFLSLYWALFTTIGFFKVKNKESEHARLALLLLNSFIFTTGVMHHLHVYYPSLKYIFPLAMGIVFAILSAVEANARRPLFSDLYLAFSVSLFCLAVPLYFDGPWITYCWSRECAILRGLGLRYHKKVLRGIAAVLAVVIGARLMSMDYLERTVHFELAVPFRGALFLYFAAASAFFALFLFYRRSTLADEREKQMGRAFFLAAASIAAGIGILIGGWRTAASPLWIIEGCVLIIWGVKAGSRTAKFIACSAFLLAALRLVSVDYQIELKRVLTEPVIMARLLTVAAAIGLLLRTADWMRGPKSPDIAVRISNVLTMVTASLIIFYFYDPGIGVWISIVWGAWAFAFVTAGFALKDKVYRWTGLALFAVVVLRLFFHDFSELETLYRIVSFIGLGAVFIAASFLYSYYSKIFLVDERRS